eukprot:3607419-Amphidinium_carterae.1
MTPKETSPTQQPKFMRAPHPLDASPASLTSCPSISPVYAHFHTYFSEKQHQTSSNVVFRLLHHLRHSIK